jgi:hypothetical protein
MMAADDRFHLDDFELYQTARRFRKNTYRLIKLLPACERYCLDQQMRRAAVSVTNNIAEGARPLVFPGKRSFLSDFPWLRGRIDRRLQHMSRRGLRTSRVGALAEK